MIYTSEDVREDDKKIFQEIFDKVVKIEGQNYDKLCCNLIFVDKDTIKSVNNEQRSIDNATDVLSFPFFDHFKVQLNEQNCPYDIDPITKEISLGDILICPNIAEEQAVEYGHSTGRELAYLFVHAMFHLLGYDHVKEADAVKMRAKEEEVLTEMGLTR